MNEKKLRQPARRIDKSPFIILKNSQWMNVELTCNTSGLQLFLGARCLRRYVQEDNGMAKNF